jgi:DNA-binding transcriptional regulator YiaG
MRDTALRKPVTVRHAIGTVSVVFDALALTKVRQRAVSGHARAIRLRAGLSLDEVARVVGVSHAAVQRWETGQRKPHGEAAIRYGALLDALASEAHG